MKKTILSLLAFLFVFNCFSQKISGEWHGALKIQGLELPLVLHISANGTGFNSKLDSPQQNAYGIPMDSTIFKNDSLFISSQMGVSYTALFTKENSFVGNFEQNGLSLPLILTRGKSATTSKVPEKPKPYFSEEVFFKNEKAEITLAGTLAFPKGKKKFPAVVLISGSGAQTRRGHASFSALSDFLVRNGIAVLHYDDRGVGESKGNILTATSADFATDV
ncbi:MAG TPA: alpha/beta hydrolase, partial [Flavobacteriaceae bacterium]|nr:alpha/beta hydrolase [Flavobacteriaceae bacterium]